MATPTPRRSNRLQQKLKHAGTSRLLRLPCELRLMIWDLILDSAVVRYQAGCSEAYRAKDRAISMAIMLVCRQIYHDIGTSWIARVSFHFSSPQLMVQILSPLPPTIRSQIRRICVRKNYDVRSREPDHEKLFSWNMPDALKLLSGLQLDLLQVDTGGLELIQTRYIDELVACGNGWRELHSYVSNRHHNRHIPTGYRWKRALLERDGVESVSSLAIYCNPETLVPGLTNDAISSVNWTKDRNPPFVEYEIPKEEGNGQTDWWNSYLVVAKRGPAVRITENDLRMEDGGGVQ